MTHTPRFLLLVSALVLTLAVACAGPKPTATPLPTATRAAATATPTQAVTPTPTPTKEPEATVTILLASWGNGVFDPAKANGEAMNYQRMFQSFLLEGGGGNKPFIPGIAKSFELSADGKTWTWTIRSGVKAHNGEEINVDDVVGTLDLVYGARSKGRTGYWSDAAMSVQRDTVKVEKVAPDKVVHETSKPYLDLMTLFAPGTQPLGVILPMDYWNQIGEKEYEKAPAGAGPFKLVSVKAEQELVLERFEDYYYQPKYGFPEDRRPKFRRLVMRLVPEGATRAAALQAGQADVVEANLFMLKDVQKAGGKVAYASESSYNWNLFLDCWDPKIWCYQKEVRQALEYAINKEAIVTSLYGPEIASVRGWMNITPSSLGYMPGVTDPRPYDVAKAKDLLAQAGFPDGKGIPPFKIYTWEAGDIPMLPEMAQATAADWRKIGLQVDVVVGDDATISAKQGNRELAGNVLMRSNEARWWPMSTFISYYSNPKHKSRLCDRTVDAWCEQMAKMIEEKLVYVAPRPLAEYEPNAKEVLRVLRDDNRTWINLYVNMPWGLGPRVKDYKPWSLAPYFTAVWTIELK